MMWQIEFLPESPFFYLFLLFVAVFIVQLFFYWIIFGKLAFYKNKEISANVTHPVSVIICAKNEYLNLKKHLPLILEQDYPDFEVVVVDDASEDDSNYLLKEHVEKFSHLKVVNFKKNVNFFIGKKFPLALGIKEAKNEFLVLTDADCYPNSNQWLRNIVKHFNDENKQIVLAYSPYKEGKSFLNYFIRFETFFTAVQYFSFAIIGVPYMGVGRNLSYKKSLFNLNKGFSSHYHISSGDDDIFISQVANKKNIAVEFDRSTHVFSFPKQSFVEYFKQKRRHYTTYPYYKKGAKFLLALLSVTNMLFYLSLLSLLVFKYNILIVISLFLLRMITQLIIFKKCMNKLSEKKLLLFSPIFDVLYTIFNPILAFTNLVSRKKKWS